jgi:hypothetical protein
VQKQVFKDLSFKGIAKEVLNQFNEHDLKVVVAVQIFKGLKKDQSGDYFKEYDESKLFYVPLE